MVCSDEDLPGQNDETRRAGESASRVVGPDQTGIVAAARRKKQTAS